ncbi:uncharacterized protein UHOD_12174 [Ustilago sp. UG-2017b]|nr:uncharacterized protein UHOD_12174 [Ustilago sp. UG-2017b]
MDTSMSMSMPPVLRGSSDYYTWRRQLRIYVDGVNPMMWEAVTGTSIHPTDETDERLHISLQTTARRAVNVLLRAVAPEIAVVIEEEQTANEIWKSCSVFVDDDDSFEYKFELRGSAYLPLACYLEQRYSKGTIIQPYVLLSNLTHLVQVGSVNEFISNIEHIANERALMGHPIDAGTKLGCLLRGVQPHLRPYTAAYEAQWESLTLSKTAKVTGAPSADFELQLG